MFAPILATKLYIPSSRPRVVLRPRLVEQLDEGISSGRKLFLVSAPAGFGKTTLVGEWVAGCEQRVAWLSLDEGDNDLSRFLIYLVSSLQTIAANIGAEVMSILQAPQPAPIKSILTTLLNEITTVSADFILVLDDYHLIDSEPINQALTFLLDHLPPQMHLVITTREDPSLPLPRLRGRGQLTELRAADLRFTLAEATEFLNRMMGLNLSEMLMSPPLKPAQKAGLPACSWRPFHCKAGKISPVLSRTFTGSHHFVLDYLMEEVLQRQLEPVRSFLLQTSILGRFCVPLCNAVTEREDGKEMLGVLEHDNIFLIPLDVQRQWYRYHHLFADVLQTHLLEIHPDRVSILHQRASAWYEQNGLRSDAIRHALAARDFERAAGLIELAWPEAEQ